MSGADRDGHPEQDVGSDRSGDFVGDPSPARDRERRGRVVRGLGGSFDVGTVARSHPFVAAVGLVCLLWAVQVVEVLLGVHEWYGTPVVGPAVTVAVSIVLVWVDWPTVLLDRGVGFRRVVVLGVGGILAANVGAVGVQMGWLAVRGRPVRFLLRPENPMTGVPGEDVLLYLIFGVVAVAVGQELLFRGLALGALERRVGFHRANALQAGLFGAWHLSWPLTVAASGLQSPAPLWLYAVGTVAVTGVVGAVFGVLARATGTVWTAILGHLVHNGLVVFVHVRAGTIDQARVLSATLVMGYAVLAALAWWRYRERFPETG